MFPYLDSVARRYSPVIVWAVIGMNVVAFLYQTSLPPRVLDWFLFEFALVPRRKFGIKNHHLGRSFLYESH